MKSLHKKRASVVSSPTASGEQRNPVNSPECSGKETREIAADKSPELIEALGERQGQRTDLASGELVDNYPQAEAGQKTREIAADKAGFGSEFTYRQAKTVSVLIWRVRIFRKILRNIQAVAHCGARLKSLFEEQAKQRQYRYSRLSNQRGSLFPK